MSDILDYIQVDSNTTFPVFRNLWDIFSVKGTKTVFVSVGTSESPLVELHISESLGCKIHLFDPEETNIEKWKSVQELLKVRIISDEIHPFATPALKKWVLPKNIFTYNTLPQQFQAVTSNCVKLSNLNDDLKTICSDIPEPRIDILKLDCSTSVQQNAVLQNILSQGYRPGMILIHWSESPDSSLENTLMAGHLQMIGYGLVEKCDTNFLYWFTDENYYESCSWEVTTVKNPFIATLLKENKPLK